jgi:hypothetical protein
MGVIRNYRQSTHHEIFLELSSPLGELGDDGTNVQHHEHRFFKCFRKVPKETLRVVLSDSSITSPKARCSYAIDVYTLMAYI